ncbi:helix-turn-helix domain-containing protein [Novosphingobium lindaniclasticum]
MAETLFALDKRNYRDGQRMFRGSRDQEYYRGDFWVEDAPNVEVRSERKAVGAMSIIRQRSASNLSFRRSRQHIREDATDLSILWFVRKGELGFSDQCGSKLARPGDLMITRSMSPFLIECRTDSDGAHEVLHVTVPTHLLRSHIAQDLGAGLVLVAGAPELAMAERMLGEVFADDGQLGESSARLLVETAIALVANAVRLLDQLQPARQSIADRRLEEVLRFIEVHLSDPQLSTAMVAKGCGISPRYLSFLLRLRDTSFSELVWEQRLTKARDWLGRSDPRDISISEIAYGVGFKSPAHFSRMFKRVFGANPREYRGECGGELAACQHGVAAVADKEPFVELVSGSQLLQ